MNFLLILNCKKYDKGKSHCGQSAIISQYDMSLRGAQRRGNLTLNLINQKKEGFSNPGQPLHRLRE